MKKILFTFLSLACLLCAEQSWSSNKNAENLIDDEIDYHQYTRVSAKKINHFKENNGNFTHETDIIIVGPGHGDDVDAALKQLEDIGVKPKIGLVEPDGNAFQVLGNKYRGNEKITLYNQNVETFSEKEGNANSADVVFWHNCTQRFSPHTLSYEPIVEGSALIAIHRILRDNGAFYVSSDSQMLLALLKPNNKLKIFDVKLVAKNRLHVEGTSVPGGHAIYRLTKANPEN